jgi:hypothetical protein
MPYRTPGALRTAPPRRCPSCDLICPARSQRCDCGFSFETGETNVLATRPKPRSELSTLGRAAGVTGGVVVFLVVGLAWLIYRLLP